jgi:hypothetical protein
MRRCAIRMNAKGYARDEIISSSAKRFCETVLLNRGAARGGLLGESSRNWK